MADGEDGSLQPLLHDDHESPYSVRSTLSTSSGILLVVLVALFAGLVHYPSDQLANDQQLEQYYFWYIHVAVMVFVGFGFLMTFLRTYSYSAVGFNYLYSCYVTLVAIIVVGIANQVIGKQNKHAAIELTMPLLIDSVFCAAATMISFGAVIGKTTPTQTLWLLVLEVPVYAVNMKLAEYFGALDIGGSITIHMFGAYYGLAASMVLSRKKGSGSDHAKNSAVRVSDMTAMIGSLFLFIFWPSFVGALASDSLNPKSSAQFYCVMNTIIALFGSCCAAFAASAAILGKFDMVHIQNSTLAGGVAIGSAANLHLTPGGALGIGILIGIISVMGYAYIQPALEDKVGLRDTCGVHNLHGLPGLLGGVIAAITALTGPNLKYLNYGNSSTQFWHQIVVIVITAALAILGGSLIALCLKKLWPSNLPRLEVEHMYEDSMYWEDGFAAKEMGLLDAET